MIVISNYSTMCADATQTAATYVESERYHSNRSCCQIQRYIDKLKPVFSSQGNGKLVVRHPLFPLMKTSSIFECSLCYSPMHQIESLSRPYSLCHRLSLNILRLSVGLSSRLALPFVCPPDVACVVSRCGRGLTSLKLLASC